MLFVVRREGVYNHEICGIFSSEDLAISCANFSAENDVDSWHTYVVIPFEIDVILEQRGSFSMSPDILENSEIYSISKSELKK